VKKIPEWVWKVMSLLVIPLVVWGIKVHVDNVTQSRDLVTLKADVEKHKTALEAGKLEATVQNERIGQLQRELAEAKGMKKAIEANTLTLVELKTKIDGTNETLKEIKELLRQP